MEILDRTVQSAALWPAKFAQTGLEVYREDGDVSALRQARRETSTIIDLAENGEQAEVITKPLLDKAKRTAFEKQFRPLFDAAIAEMTIADRARYAHFSDFGRKERRCLI